MSEGLLATGSAGQLSRREWFTLPTRRPLETAGHWIHVHRPAMAGRVEITLPGEDGRHIEAAREALDEVDRLETTLSVFRETSEVAEINRSAAAGAMHVGPDVLALLRRSQVVHAATDGAFDVTSMPLSRCWGFLRRAGRLPAVLEIEAAREVVGMPNVVVDEAARTVRFARPGVELSFNAIGKGYAVDCVAALLRRRGVGQALVSAGGSSLRAFGGGGEGFAVDVRSARVAGRPLARLRLRDAALGTSGAGEQFFEVGGRRYGHVIDPRTGWPAEGLLSVSVVADEAALADALATAFLVGGAGLAERYCAAHPGTMALVTAEAQPEDLLVFGTHPGATLEAGRDECGARHASTSPSPDGGRDGGSMNDRVGGR
jgi:FAD:protein FMN transferase